MTRTPTSMLHEALMTIAIVVIALIVMWFCP